MTPKKIVHDMTAPEMTRVAVRVPKTTLDEINLWVDELGVRRSHFLGIALVAGARTLVRACLPPSPAVEEEPQEHGVDLMDHLSAAPKLRSTPGTLPTQAQSAIDQMQSEIAALRAEIGHLQDRLARADRPKKGRQQAPTEHGGSTGSALPRKE